MDVKFFTQNIISSFLEAEVNPSGLAKFEAEYIAETGEQPISGNGYQRQENKWGTECRIYFNSDSDLKDQFSALGIDVEQGRRPYKNEWKFRVNNNEFFWNLIRAGYRLGRN